MNLAVFNIQDRASFFKDAQRWAAGWTSGYDNALTYYKVHFKASAEGYKAAAGRRGASAWLCCKPVKVGGRASNGCCLVSYIIVPVVLNKQLWHAGRWYGEAGGLINGQQQPCAVASEDTVRGAAEKHFWHRGGRRLFEAFLNIFKNLVFFSWHEYVKGDVHQRGGGSTDNDPRDMFMMS